MSTAASRAWWKRHERDFFAIVDAERQPSNGKRQADGLGREPVPVIGKLLFIEHKASKSLKNLSQLVNKAITQLDECPPTHLPVIGLTWAQGTGHPTRRFLLVELKDDEEDNA